MPFIDSSQTLRSRLHLASAPVPVLVGIAALALLSVFMVASNVLALLEGESALVVRKGDSVQEGDGPVASASSMPANASDALALSSGSASNATVVSSGSQPAEGGAVMAQGDEAQPLYVFVSGAVASPGVYQLDPGARAVDAVDAAGGFAPEAATDAVNLARILQDGEQVAIPTVEQVERGDYAIRDVEQASGVEAPPGGEASPGASPVNINTATEAELQTLTGVGPATAAKIVASREAEGPFASEDDLMRVTGIGEKKLEALRGQICV